MLSFKFLTVTFFLGVTCAGLYLAQLNQRKLGSMSERKSVTYTFQGFEEYAKQNETVTTIIKEDTGSEFWRMNRMLPPTAYPPPLTLPAIEKLKTLEGVIVNDLEETGTD
ncbi:hypothetical protein B0I35DRAFT_444844 [Stachybotrys elegans]|uniref:Uncharacterized protein n=1 Tax=Stachybotrys elegans TaxID=80388 RepID=A0A8K0SFA3_9HYPO|nr:hypothetical protein B0I35DRAFT_444844 [Stachybotrys elegans]